VTLFRPCIDLHEGKVKQIVGGSLSDTGLGLETNFVADEGAASFAARYRDDALPGGHVICLGPGNDAAARSALDVWPGGMQLGGGVNDTNAEQWLEAGASHVIVTSWLFVDEALSMERVRRLASLVGRERLVIDLSCRRHGEGWRVATNRWQTITEIGLDADVFARLAEHCAEFLVHAADVEGKCRGIDEDLVSALGRLSPIPCTYAGGARHIDDLKRVDELSGGRVHLTFGSALDLFGGSRVKYADCVAWNRSKEGGASS
jgi:phosphoribosylformimino-5-aminoimidazole carboxamide ribotide isomerase